MASPDILSTPSVLPQSGSIPDIELKPVPLVRQINELRWWESVLYLEKNPTVDSCSASHPHNEWSWKLARTPEKGIYLQTTYYYDKPILATKMNTNIEGREEFIAHFFHLADK
jgi:hypothetical protein